MEITFLIANYVTAFNFQIVQKTQGGAKQEYIPRREWEQQQLQITALTQEKMKETNAER